jgi:hypothetical protein
MRAIFLLSILITFLVCCKKKDPVKDNMTEFINVTLHKDNINPDENKLVIFLRNSEVSQCYIESDINNYDNSFSIHAKKIINGFCVDTVAYASVRWAFPKLQNGEYPVSIKIGNNKTNNGKLIVSDRKYEIKMESLERLRFPEGTILEY